MIGLAMMVSATALSATELKTLCMSTNANDQLFCGAYIIGVADGIHIGAMAVDLSKDNDTICVPVGTIRQEIVDLVKAYLREKKMDEDADGSVYVYGALDSKWRCRAPKS